VIFRKRLLFNRVVRTFQPKGGGHSLGLAWMHIYLSTRIACGVFKGTFQSNDTWQVKASTAAVVSHVSLVLPIRGHQVVTLLQAH
jgi:hypothetical protein